MCGISVYLDCETFLDGAYIPAGGAASCCVKYDPCSSYGSVEIMRSSRLAGVIAPGFSLGKNAAKDLVVRVSSSHESKSVGEVGSGFISTLVVLPGNVLATHAPTLGLKGKELREESGQLRDVGLSGPVHPDKPAKRIVSVLIAIFVFSVAETGGTSPSVVGIGSRIAQQFFKPNALLGQ